MIYSETTTSISAGDITTTSPTNIRLGESVSDGDDMKVRTMTKSGETARKMFQMIFNSMFHVETCLTLKPSIIYFDLAGGHQLVCYYFLQTEKYLNI